MRDWLQQCAAVRDCCGSGCHHCRACRLPRLRPALLPTWQVAPLQVRLIDGQFDLVLCHACSNMCLSCGEFVLQINACCLVVQQARRHSLTTCRRSQAAAGSDSPAIAAVAMASAVTAAAVTAVTAVRPRNTRRGCWGGPTWRHRAATAMRWARAGELAGGTPCLPGLCRPCHQWLTKDRCE